jgi:hypothetical protein
VSEYLVMWKKGKEVKTNMGILRSQVPEPDGVVRCTGEESVVLWRHRERDDSIAMKRKG